jgi:hypothetical protein
MEQHTIKHFSFNTITHNVSFPLSEGLVAVFFRCPYQVCRVFLCFTPDKAIIVLFTIALVAGLAGGFTLSYVIYQPQIQGLRNDGITLNKAIADNFTDYQAALDNLNATIQSKLNTTENAPSQENTNQSTSNTPPLNLVENVGVQNLAATKNGANSDISFNLKNTGTAPAALDVLSLNGTSQQNVADLNSIVINGITLSKIDILAVILYPGDTASGTISLTIGGAFASGDIVTLAFHSTTNKFYQQSVVLP